MRIHRVLGLWLAVLLAAGVGSPALRAASATNTIIIGTTDRPTVLEPAMSYEFPGWWVIGRTHDFLYNLDPRTERPVPALATDYEVSEDGLTYTFHLRRGVTFTDGAPFNAEAVKFTFERNLKLNGDPVWLIQGIEEIRVVDPYTVQFVLSAPDATFLQKLSFTAPAAILSPNTFTAATVQETQRTTDRTGTIGTGLYRIAQFVPD
ncbi:MAG TPA: ABC transporter substrate-binding protein, partial [Limnochordia bacterium]